MSNSDNAMQFFGKWHEALEYARHEAVDRHADVMIMHQAKKTWSPILGRAWDHTITAAKVRPIRPYDLRHTFASLLSAAGKNPLYIARQMGHHSAGFTFDIDGHLMDALPKHEVEWIDELVFAEGFAAAVNLYLYGAPSVAVRCCEVPFIFTENANAEKPLENDTSRSTGLDQAAGSLVAGERFRRYSHVSARCAWHDGFSFRFRAHLPSMRPANSSRAQSQVVLRFVQGAGITGTP